MGGRSLLARCKSPGQVAAASAAAIWGVAQPTILSREIARLASRSCSDAASGPSAVSPFSGKRLLAATFDLQGACRNACSEFARQVAVFRSESGELVIVCSM